MPSRAIAGVVAPMATPFSASGELDPGRFVDHARWMLAQGCTALAPFGTTSEANSLSIAERKVLLISLLAAGLDPSLIIPGTGLCSLPETMDLTRHAVDLGCAGVLVLPPFYYKGVTDEGLYRHFAQLIDRVADNRLRVYLYHIPQLTQIGLSLPLLQRLQRDYPLVVAGVKDSSGDWTYSKQAIAAMPGFKVFSASETMLLDNLKAGGAGCISATANLNAKSMRRLFEAPDAAGAQDLQKQVSAARAEMQKRPLIPATKAMLAHFRKDAGWRNMRAPLEPLPQADSDSLAAALVAAGFTMDAQPAV